MDTLCLSLDWSNRRLGGTYVHRSEYSIRISQLTFLPSRSDLGSLVVSLSNGSICLLRPIDGAGLSVIEIWHAHDYEPWVAAWDYWNRDIIYSGPVALFSSSRP
jgi:diphthamide biosynthesis protein 7